MKEKNIEGLTDKQVIANRSKYGKNEITSKKADGFFKLLLGTLGDPIIKILLIALAIKTIFLIKDFDWYETVGIVIAIFLASFISTISEYGLPSIMSSPIAQQSSTGFPVSCALRNA